MEIVCSALTGINKTLKEIDFNQDKHTFLTQEDFKYKKREKLKQIKVLSPEYFASMKAKQVMDFQELKSDDLYRVTDQEEGDARKTDPLKASIKDNIKRDHLDGKIKEEDVDVDIDILSYAPRVFRFIRAIDKIDEFDIMKSVKPELNRLQIFKVKEKQDHQNGGKSGSFFFFTEDKNYIIKTMS